MAYTPSASFQEAATYVSKSSGLGKTPNETKLELYGLYKVLSVSAEPTISRPSIFSPTERAKYDAWKSAGTKWRGREPDAEARYLEIAKNLGWTPGNSGEMNQQKSPAEEPTVEELLAEDTNDDKANHSDAGGGMGPSVSVMKKDDIDGEQSLHSIAISGDIRKIEEFFKANPGLDVNDLDEYGFTALHLACDRGNVEVVEILLQKGADPTLKDSDGFSALDLAIEANHENIAALLKSALGRDSS